MTIEKRSPTLRLGLFGLGVVGQGLYDVLERTPGLSAEVVRVCVKDLSKPRALPASLITYEAEDILNDDRINVVVELIDDHEAAFRYVSEALRKGKAVVTANKRMVANNLEALIALQRRTGRPLLYEASTAGSIPIIRNLEEYYDSDLLSGVEGIVNGTTNYILTRVHLAVADAAGGATGDAYATALQEAQRLGFAESDPTMDVEAWDATFKTVIIAAHAFGTVIRPDDVVRRGITAVAASDVEVARSRGAVIKLLARVLQHGNGFSAMALPTFVPQEDSLAGVANEVNGVRVRAAFSDAQLLVGKGAGGHPTASAVLSDISAQRYGYRYEYKKIAQGARLALDGHIPVRVYVRATAELLDSVPWITVEVDHREHGRSYRIGTVDLMALRASKAFEDRATFVAAV
ncbi:MAG: homoserine dehydrogenase [Flavobacteriales bacterium]